MRFPKLRIRRVYEILRGRYDGSYRITGECPNCGGEVLHILEDTPADETHKLCNAGCHGVGYETELPRAFAPLIEDGPVLTGEFNPDGPAVRNLGFTDDELAALVELDGEALHHVLSEQAQRLHDDESEAA